MHNRKCIVAAAAALLECGVGIFSGDRTGRKTGLLGTQAEDEEEVGCVL